MSELIKPKGYGEYSLPTDLIRAALPLEGTTVERNPLNDCYEFVAPDGFGFRMQGNFYIAYDSNSMDFYQPPTASRQNMEADYAAMVRGDEYYGEMPPPMNPSNYPTEFIGKRLALRLRRNGYVPGVKAPELTDDEKKRVGVLVYGTYNARADSSLQGFTWDVAGDSTITEHEYVSVPLTHYTWWRDEAEGTLLSATIDLVPYDEPNRDITAVTMPEEYSKIEIIQNGRLLKDAADLLRLYRPDLADMPDDEFEEWTKRVERLNGTPVAEDPLKNLRIVRGDGINLDQEVLRVGLEAQYAHMTYGELDVLRTQANTQAWAKSYADKLRTEIAIIALDKPLRAVVAEKAASGWLRYLLEERFDDLAGYDPDAPVLLNTGH